MDRSKKLSLIFLMLEASDKKKLPARILTSITVLLLILAGSPFFNGSSNGVDAASNPYASASISNLANSGPTSSGSFITWDTNVSSNNRVYYGLNENDINNLINGSWSAWSNNTFNVSIRLSGLAANNTYFYKPQSWYFDAVNDSVPAGAFVTLKPGVWVSPSEYMVSPEGWMGSPSNFRTVNISAAVLDSNGRYILGLSLEAVIYNSTGSEIGRTNLGGNGPYSGNFLLPDYLNEGGYVVRITGYPIAGEFSVLRWSCANCHSAGGDNYPSAFDPGTVHPKHFDTTSIYVEHPDPGNIITSTGQCADCHGLRYPTWVSHPRAGRCSDCHKLPSGGNAALVCGNCHNDKTTTETVLSPRYGQDKHSAYACSDCHGTLTSLTTKPSCTTCHPRPDSILSGTTIPGSIENKSHSLSQTVACGLCHNREHDVKSLQTLDATVCRTCHLGINHDGGNQCTTCHGGDPHRITLGGSPDCVSSGCHGSTGSPSSPYMNWTSLKSGMHAKLNNGTGQAAGMTDPIVEACWACHGNGTKPSGHPANFKQPYNCTACHLPSGSQTGKYQAKNVTEHQHVDAQLRTNSTYGRCEDCHNNSLVDYFDNETNKLTNYTLGNVSHYGANKTAGKLMYNSSGNSKDCVYCHLNSSNREKWANATNASATKPEIHGNYNSTTSSSQCWNCHVNTGASGVTSEFTLHNASLNRGASEFCLNCHVAGGSVERARRINVSKEDLGLHVNLNNGDGNGNLSNGDCWICHFGYPQPGSSRTHSFDVNRDNTYYCEDCHGPNKNATAIPNATTKVLAEYYHGKSYDDALPKYKDCTICHAPNTNRRDSSGNRLKVYHNQTPLGKVANTGWNGWTVGRIPGCNDCHQTHNANDEPFHAPGKDHYVSSSGGCSTNCHDGGSIHMQNLFGDIADLWGITPPVIQSITINNIVIPGDYVNFTAIGTDNYCQIEAGRYRVINSNGTQVIGWTNMTQENSRSRIETLRGSIDTTYLASGNYTVYMQVMASGPRTDQTKRAYPLNGAWSNVYSTGFTVLGG